MPKFQRKKEVPPQLKSYHSLGVDLNWSTSGKEATADCPFCGTESKFTVNISSGQWRCFVCGNGSAKGGGNVYTFLSLLHEQSKANTTSKDYKHLAEDRNLLDPNSLKEWGLVKSAITGDWLFPSYNLNKENQPTLIQLYRYANMGGKLRLLATSELKHGLFGINLYTLSCKVIFITEGPWDGIALREVLTQSKSIKSWCVVSVPGCNVFNSNWCDLFAKKQVNLCFDNDYPKINPQTKQLMEPAGYAGMKRVTGILANAHNSPKEINHLAWGENGFNSALENGMDIRDFLCQK